MTLRRPSRADLIDISRARHLSLTEVELDEYYELVCANLSFYDTLDQYPEPAFDVVPAVRVAGTRPLPKDDPLNAVVRNCSVHLPGAQGRLAGRTIGLKDTISVAGIPMSCASRLLYDYVPERDATIVKRLLADGAHITAILNTDDFALARHLNTAYERVFATYDLVVMPTTPQTAHAMLASQETDRKTFVRQALNMCANTAAFDLTGHPSISVPCKAVDGLPVGLMITGRHFDDATVLRAAHAYEQGGA